MAVFQPKRKQLSAPKMSSGSSGVSQLMAYMMAQKKSEMSQQAMPGGIPTRRTDPLTGITEETQQGQDLDIENAGRKKAVTDAATALQALRKLTPILDEFETGFMQAYPGAKEQKGLSGKFEAAKRIFLGKILENDPEFAAYVDQLEGKRSQIAKGLGEVGNLAEQEQKVAMQNVPSFKMGLQQGFLPQAPATGAAKLPKFRNFVEKQIQQNMDVINSGGRFNPIDKPASPLPDTSDYQASGNPSDSTIRVRHKIKGITGKIDPSKFDPSKYERI